MNWEGVPAYLRPVEKRDDLGLSYSRPIVKRHDLGLITPNRWSDTMREVWRLYVEMGIR